MITTEQFELIQRMARVYATTIYKSFPVDVIITMMLRAHGLGLPVTEAPELFQQLHGKLTLSANAMATLIKRAGYSWIVNHLDDERAELTIYDHAGNELGKSIFTIEDAQQAEIIGKNKNWDNYPRNMLMARALSNAAKWFAPDAFGGAPIYTPDELGSDDDAGYTEPDDTPPPANVAKMHIPALEGDEEYLSNIQPDATPAVDILDVEEDEETHAPVGSKGNLSAHWRKVLFAVGTEWAAAVHNARYEELCTKHAQGIIGSDIESFSQLNNGGAKQLVLRMERDLVTKYGLRLYPDEWIQRKEAELCQAVSNGPAISVDDLNRSELGRLLNGGSKPGLREKANAA